jgi:hypothetical protein
MRRFVFAVAAALLLASCTSNPVPEGYDGPLARVTDSVTWLGRSSADFFYLSKIDGRTIDESLSATNRSNSGRGMIMDPVTIDRRVPARTATVTIVGRRHYAAPILEMARTVYQVSGEIEFTPLPDHSYVVKGILSDKYSAVWIEDKDSRETVGRKVEVLGSAKLGFFEK